MDLAESTSHVHRFPCDNCKIEDQRGFVPCDFRCGKILLYMFFRPMHWLHLVILSYLKASPLPPSPLLLGLIMSSWLAAWMVGSFRFSILLAVFDFRFTIFDFQLIWLAGWLACYFRFSIDLAGRLAGW